MKPRRHRLDDRSIDALLSGRAVAGEPELSAFVAQLQAMTPATAPTPSAELAALLEHGVPAGALVTGPTVVPVPARRAVSWRYALVSAAAASAAVLGAGAANALPAPAQRAVADVVGWISPLHLPRPAGDQHLPAVVPSSTPTTTPTAGASESHRPVPGTSPSPRSGRDGGGPDVQESPNGSDGGGSGSDGGSSGDSPQPKATSSTSSDGGGSSDGGSTGGGSSDGGSSPTPQPSSTSGDGSGTSASGSSTNGSSGSGSSSGGTTTDLTPTTSLDG